MPKWSIPAAVVCGLMFAVSPVLIANAPYESTMGLVQKIFYVHLPSALTFLLAAIVCGSPASVSRSRLSAPIGSPWRRRSAWECLAYHPHHGPLWGGAWAAGGSGTSGSARA